MGSLGLMGNEPWPIGVCPCPNGSRNKKNTFFLSSNLRMAMILNIHSLFFFQKVKLTYEYSAKYQPINERELLPLPGVPKNLVFRKSRI